jgi:hypothetical protein
MAAPKGNKFALGNKGGAPLIYNEDETSLQILIENISNYFEYIKGETKKEKQSKTLEDGSITIVEVEKIIRHPEPPSITGLALALGFKSKSTLYDYAKKDMFSYSIKRALLVIENYHEIQIAMGDKCTGNIFALKNFGWKDNSSIDVTTQGDKLGVSTEELRLLWKESLKHGHE